MMQERRDRRHKGPRLSAGRTVTFLIDGLTLDQVGDALYAAEQAGNRERVIDIVAGLMKRIDQRLAGGKRISQKLEALLHDARAAMHRMPISAAPAPSRAPKPAPPQPKAPHLVEYDQLLTRYRNLLAQIMLPRPTADAEASARRAHKNFNVIAREFKAWEHKYPPDQFPWPSTVSSGSGEGSMDANFAEISPLSVLGYVVGKTAGRPEAERRLLLDWAYANHLPPVESPDYMADWGAPQTVARLRRIAEHIARQGQLRRKAFGGRDRAVKEWQADLDYLKDTYYEPRFGDVWPSTQ